MEALPIDPYKGTETEKQGHIWWLNAGAWGVLSGIIIFYGVLFSPYFARSFVESSAAPQLTAAAMGAVAEKPEIAGQALIFVALAEGLVVFGFITALMILGKV